MNEIESLKNDKINSLESRIRLLKKKIESTKDIKAEKETIDLNKREIHRLQKEFEEKQTGLNLGGALSHWMGYSVLPLLQRIAMACKSM